MASRYGNGKRFSKEDAFQSAMEGLLRAGVPDDEGLRILSMKNGISRAITLAIFPMCIPRSSYDKMRKLGSLPDYTQNVVSSDYVFESLGHEDGYDKVEDDLYAHQLLESLDPDERRVVSMWVNRDPKNGSPFPYRTRQADKRLLEKTLNKLREEHIGE